MMNIGIYGTGFIVPVHIENVKNMEGLHDYAVCSTERSFDKAKQICEKYGLEKAYNNYEEMLKDEAIDIIYLATPNATHYQYAMQAIQAGKHVFCEKPFTTTLDQAKQLFQAAKEHNVRIVEAITNFYYPSLLQMKEDIKQYGHPQIIHVNYSQYSSRYDRFKNGDIAPAFNPALAGGALMDLNVYCIHVITNLFGRPEKVTYYPNIVNHIDTSGMLIMEYPDFKACATAAKDSASKGLIDIQFNDGYTLYSNEIPSSFSSYQILYKSKVMETRDFEKTDKTMKYELEGLKKILNGDEELYNRACQQTLNVMEVIEKGYTSANIEYK